jgi:16S rRNA (cytosine967-C5)-methyltransferase
VTSAADPRALAAAALAAIVGGAALPSVTQPRLAVLPDPRDRALFSALVREGARWWLRYAPAVAELLHHPLRDATLHALLVLGLIQLEVLRIPDYAAVAATVTAIDALGRRQQRALGNAVLRRWLRERTTRLARLDADPVTRSAHPRWLIEALAADWPDAVQALLVANNRVAPLWLRVNRRWGGRAQLQARLAAAGVEAFPAETLPDALKIADGVDVQRLPGYAEGAFSVQDGAAQFAAGLLALAEGQRVLDACAAPGGKSAHILECARVELLALERDPKRLARLAENLDRLGLRCRLQAGDAGRPETWWDGRPFDRILLDAPCSATGIIRRQPDIKLHRRASDVRALAAEQRRLLEALWPLLRRGGRLVYVTCSVLRAENAAPVAAFLRAHADARPLPGPPGWRTVDVGAQNLPGDAEMDGFFYAVLEKI